MISTKSIPTFLFILSLVALSLPAGAAAEAVPIDIAQLGRATDENVEATAEIAAFAPDEDLVFTTDAENNEIDVYDISNPESPAFSFSIDLSPWGQGPNSVAYTPAFGGAVAVAIEDNPRRGSVQLFDLRGSRIAGYGAGWLPDMVTTANDGRTLLVANEGEPLADEADLDGDLDTDELLSDPPGSVTVIDLPADGADPRDALVREAGFTGVPLSGPVRIFMDATFDGPRPENDLEPEYITVQGERAWVSIQEANAIGILDISTARFEVVRSLGFKDHGIEGQGLDPSDRDGPGGGVLASVVEPDNVYGMYQPDAIASFGLPVERDREPDQVAADRRDAVETALARGANRERIRVAGREAFRRTYRRVVRREVGKGTKRVQARRLARKAGREARSAARSVIRREVAAEARAGVETTEETTDFYVATANEGDSRDWPFYSEESRAKDLDLDPAVFSPTAGDDAELGRLTVTTTLGDRDNDGLYEALYAFGGRSMSLLDADARMVFDTGDQLEQLSISLDPGSFNKDNDSSNIDNRSDNKGPEPEAVATGEVGDTTYAFLAAERSGMIYAFDVSSTPGEALFAGWINSREDDLGPEGMVFLSSSESPNGSPMLLVTYEITGTVGLYSLSQDS
jgi:hypothetical protein